MKRHTHRSGFTLIELLVVISIIGLLVGLTAAGLFRLQASQREKVTNDTLTKLHEAMDQQWRTVIAAASKESIPSNTLLAAGNDNIRARVLHIKWRLRQEFPQTFKEAVADNPVDAVYYHKPTYTKYLAGASFGTDTPENESAVCLLMVLSQARGSTFDPENVGATSIGTKNIGGRDFQVFVDQTRLPIAFARWTTNVAVLDEYSLPPHVPTGATFLDPQDPEGKLVNLPAGVLAVLNGLVDNQVPPQKLLHPIGPAPTDNRNRTWIIYAAGHDKIYGNQDDLLSFRLRGTGKAGN